MADTYWKRCPDCNGEGQVDRDLITVSTCSPPHKTTMRVHCPRRCRSGLVPVEGLLIEDAQVEKAKVRATDSLLSGWDVTPTRARGMVDAVWREFAAVGGEGL
jgi:hypothetical protein